MIRETTPVGYATDALARVHRTADRVAMKSAGRLAPEQHLRAANLGLLLLAKAWGTGYPGLRADIHDHLWRRSFVLTYSEALEWFTAARNRGELDEPMTALQWRAINHAIAASEVAAQPLSYDEELVRRSVPRLRAEAVERVSRQHSAATESSMDRRIPEQQVAVERERRLAHA